MRLPFFYCENRLVFSQKLCYTAFERKGGADMEYRIAVCDDQPAQLENLTKKLSLYAEARHIKFHIQTYPSA
jgi:hypothetical protein